MKTINITDLRRAGIGGASTDIYVSVKGNERRYWYSVGDAVQAIKRIEQDLHDNPPDDWKAFRELFLAMTGATGSGCICIADEPEKALAMIRQHTQTFPWLMLDLNRTSTRILLDEYLNEDQGLGKFGTADLQP